MKAICEGRKTKAEVVHETIEQYREVYILTQRRLDMLRAVSCLPWVWMHALLITHQSVRKYIFGQNG